MLTTVLSTYFGSEFFFHSLDKRVNLGVSLLRTNKRCLGDRLWEEMLQVLSLCQCQQEILVEHALVQDRALGAGAVYQ